VGPEKLYYVERYFTIFNKGMHRKWPRRAYVDLMAGPGRCITDAGDEFAGSPVLAAKSEPHFEKCVFVEKEPVLQRALAARTESFKDRVRVVAGDCNDPAIIRRVRQEVPANALGITFVDMLGLNVWLSTLKDLTVNRRMDLVITLQVHDFTRNALSASSEQQGTERFDRFFGSPDWRQVVADCASRQAVNADIATALTGYYTQRLATIGYPYVHELHVLMKNTRNAPLYRLVLAAKHEQAVKFFKSIAEIEHSGQRGLTLE
jgi:three-Cys-motif partner protein